MGHRARAALLERQSWWGAIERLDLALFIAAQDDGMLRGREVEADEGGELFGKVGIVGDLKGPHQMRLESVCAPNPPHRARAQVHRLGHRGTAPMRLRWRRPTRGFLDQQPAHFRGIGWLAATARRILFDARPPGLCKARAPAAYFVG